jgi:iron complex outermembrane receptor protein/vitamin B12 transporter
MPTLRFLRAKPARFAFRALAAFVLAQAVTFCPAASIRGVVTDATGAKVSGASVALIGNGKVIASTVSSSNGSFELTTGTSGRFFLVVSASSFRQLQTPDFYAGQFDSIERNLVLEPAWVRESIVVTATGTPTPQPQTSAAIDVLGPLDLATRDDLTSVLRLMPGGFVAQVGQLGAQASLFVRGGDSDNNKILVDGVDAGDLGNQFDFGPLSTTAIESAEVYRGPDSNLFGAGAESGVVSLTTPHGTTSFPSLLFQGEAGSFYTSREQLEVAGAHRKLDYLGAFSWLETSNDLPNDEFHVATAAANLGWALNSTTQIRGTAHYGVSATGVPSAWDFYDVADDATQKDQDLFVSAAIDNRTTASFHQSATYGAIRRGEQYHQWAPEGTCIPAGGCGGPGIPPTYSGANFYGLPVTIQGANGYSASGQALLDYSWDDGATYPNESQLVSNRDQLVYRGDIAITPHLMALIGFQYEDERGAATYYSPVERSNYDYQLAVHGDFKGRLFYTLGGSLEHYSLFGVETPPRAGVSYYALRPRSGVFSGTRILFNYGESDREPTLPEQDESLYAFLETCGGVVQPCNGQSTIQALHINQIGAPEDRTYEGGFEQTFLSSHILLRASYFHNEFGRQIEYVGLDLIPELLPNLTPAQQTALETTLQDDGAFELTINSEAFRAQGVESTVESGIGKNLFLRGGYTYLDAVVQRSFTNDDEALLGPIPTFTNGIPIGPYSPLAGARPFRRPPHTGFFSATYATKKITGVFSAAFASRSDDSTYLEGEDATGTNANGLLLPNRNLDYGYAKLDLGGSYQLLTWMDVYAQADNLLNNQHIAPIGYPSLPFNVRAGLRLRWGPGSGR